MSLSKESRLTKMAAFYIYDKEHNIIPVDDGLVWAKFFRDDKNREIKRDYLSKGTKREILISTIFLGLPHILGAGTLNLFETMIFGGGTDLDQYQRRYDTGTKQ